MRLIIYFIAITLAANVATYLIGLLVEHWLGSGASLLYFLSIWMAWVLAVRVTAPKVVAAELPAGAT